MSKYLQLFFFVAALFGAVWWADRQKPDKLDRRVALVEQIEHCKARAAESDAAVKKDLAELLALKETLEALKAARRKKEYNALLPEYNAKLEKSQEVHRADDDLAKMCDGLQRQYHLDW